MTLLVVVAFVAVVVANGSGSGVGDNNTNSNTGTTLINKPTLPGDDSSTESTLGGSTTRCKDGTYTFVGGGAKTSDEDLCKNNGGVDARVP